MARVRSNRMARKQGTVPVSGVAINRIREAWGLTQEDFATVIGVRRLWVIEKEAADFSTMRVNVLRNMAVAMGLTPDEVLSLLLKLSYRKMEPSADRVLGPVKIPPLKPEVFQQILNVSRLTEQRIPAEPPTYDLRVAAGGFVDVPEVGQAFDQEVIRLGLFRVRIGGDSMEPRYLDGDLVEFRLLRPDDALIVGRNYYVQRRDDGATFKTLANFDDEQLTLRAINRRKYPAPMIVDRSEISNMAIALHRLEPDDAPRKRTKS